MSTGFLPCVDRQSARTKAKRLLIVVSCAIVASLAILPIALQAAPPGWNLTISDEFNGTTVDQSLWEPIFWNTPHNNELQAYRPSRVTVSGGNLVLTADDENNGGKSYTSGKVESKFTQHHGRWEVRAKLPGTRGTWPAIWLLPATQTWPWPSQGEIDILENRGNQPTLTSSAFHWGPDFNGRQFRFDEHHDADRGTLDNFHDEFHTYAVEWDATKLRFFVDDIPYYTITNANTANTHYPGGFLAQQTAPMELNLNVAVGGDFLPNPNGSSVWPQQMLIDYVRVYERDANPPPIVFRNGGFEEQEGSLAGWTPFGNAFPNVQTHNEAVFEGDDALKLFGQFNGGQNFSGVEQGISVAPGDSISAKASAYIRSADSIAGTGNTVAMKFDYYSEFGGEFGSNSYLSSKSIVIADGNTINDAWIEQELTDTAPAGAAEARFALVFIQPADEGGAVHIDGVTFENLDLATPADADDNNKVNGVDFLRWQRGFGLGDGTSPDDGDFNFDGVVAAGDLSLWEEQFGDGNVTLVSAVPEPTTMGFFLGAALSMIAPVRPH